MTFDAWWLLAIPLFFVLGWFAARFDARQSGAGGGMPDAYFRGLNFLLNEQPDKAIDAFIDVVQVDPETIELHFALGNLFRRRGETDRAIRVHQNLIERRDLDAEQREHALFELGQDYLRAGLIDRAEDAFNRLEGSRYRAAALHHRLQIAQMVRDWPQAIEIAERLRIDLGENRSHELAQFHCERAVAALAADGADAVATAMEAIALATEADPRHPRPWLMRGELALRGDKPEQALAAWERMLELSPAHASLIAVPWLEASRRSGRLDEGLARLEAIAASAPSIDVFRAVFDARLARDGADAAVEWAEAILRDWPSLLALETLLSAGADGRSPRERARDDLIRSLAKDQADRLGRYICSYCGFKARTYYWQCPGCSRWDSYAPRRGEGIGE
ncbi:MAG: lipopolysaccharide assembly protein LapB [Burkholderiaceae bacterium]|jgi:lipopolysaccharide biosynthesis regulator YciM|nr:lipopolysaccharide assembly protein LapB [Burkholderiaceae bacterium]MEB2320767.1 lipopolysaccharide assembly protein LapB [Pseudomonadota bacterium]